MSCFKALHWNMTCSDSHSHIFFKIIDKADLKIKMTLHINWKKPNLNAQQNLSL